MKKFLSSVLIGTMALVSLPAKGVNAEDKIKVMSSFNAVNEIVKYIGKDKVESQMIVSPGLEPHDFEPSPQDIVKLKEAKLVFINGLGMEPWMEKVEGVKIVDLSQNVKVIEVGHHEEEHKEEEQTVENSSAKEDNHKEEGHEHDHDHGHEHGAYDPHIWLGLDELKVMAENTYKALIEVDPGNQAYYKENLDSFFSEADKLKEEFTPQFEAMKIKSFVTGHEAFAYLCRNAGLEQKAVVGVFGEGEATPQKIGELVEFVKKEKITTIFVEKGQAKEISETVAKETGIKTVEIGTLETEGEIFPTLRDICQKIVEASK